MSTQKYTDKIVIVGGGVAGINAATKLIDNGYPGELITIIDAGKDPYSRPETELMKGFAGAGLKSDGKLVYKHNEIGGHLAKYCGEEKADELINQMLENIKRFHPDPSKMMVSNPIQEPDFIKPHFNLKMALTYHIGTDYLDILGKNWYNWLVDNGINFEWEAEVTDIDFDEQFVSFKSVSKSELYGWVGERHFDKLIYCTGKSGIGLTQKLIEKNQINTEQKSSQIGVRFECPQKYFQKLLDISYDFKLYQKPNDRVSLRSFCTNSNQAYVAIEETFGDFTANGHSKSDPKFYNGMVNFGIIMEIKDIKDPFNWARNIISKCQKIQNNKKTLMFYSPNKTRQPSCTSEGEKIEAFEMDSLDEFKEIYGEYSEYIINYINNLNELFGMGDDWGIYIGEVKYLSPEVLVNYDDLSLIQYPNIYFSGDSLSARGIAVSACQGILNSQGILSGK